MSDEPRPPLREGKDPGDFAPALGLLTARGVLWNYASVLVTKGAVLVTTVVLARLLPPRDFGLVAYAVIAIELLGLVQDLGLGAALIQNRSKAGVAADTAFTLNLVAAVLLGGIALVVAPTIAAWYGEPEVAGLLGMLALSYVFEAAGRIHVARLRRAMEFQRKLGMDTVRASVKAAVAIGCGIAGLGAWSLVMGQLAGALVGTILAWHVIPWIPRLQVDRVVARQLLKFGGPLIATNLLAVAGANVALLAVGMSGPAALGAYTVADKVPALLVANLMWVAADVLFAAYARLGRTGQRLQSAFVETVRFSAIVYVPLALGIALSADLLVPAVLGSQWTDAIAPMRLLAISAMVSSLVFHVGDYVKGVGRADVALRLGGIQFAILVPATLAGATLGPVGVASAVLATEIIARAIELRIALPLVGISVGEYLRSLRTPATGAGVLTLTVIATPRLPGLSNVGQFLVVAIVGAVAYAGTIWIVDRGSVIKLMRLAFWSTGRQGGQANDAHLTREPWTR